MDPHKVRGRGLDPHKVRGGAWTGNVNPHKVRGGAWTLIRGGAGRGMDRAMWTLIR